MLSAHSDAQIQASLVLPSQRLMAEVEVEVEVVVMTMAPMSALQRSVSPRPKYKLHGLSESQYHASQVNWSTLNPQDIG